MHRRGLGDAGDRLEHADALVDEGVEGVSKRTRVGEASRQREHPAALLSRRGVEEVVEIVEVHVDGAQRDPRPLGDPARGGADVALGDEPSSARTTASRVRADRAAVRRLSAAQPDEGRARRDHTVHSHPVQRRSQVRARVTPVTIGGAGPHLHSGAMDDPVTAPARLTIAARSGSIVVRTGPGPAIEVSGAKTRVEPDGTMRIDGGSDSIDVRCPEVRT